MRQKDYYDAFNEAGRASDSAVFVVLMLEIIRDTLKATTVVGGSADQIAGKTDQVINQTDQVEGQTDQVADQDGTEDVYVSDLDNENATPVLRPLSALVDDTLAALEIMRRLGMSHRPTFRDNYLNPALREGLIERTIPDKPSSRSQKYRKCR